MELNEEQFPPMEDGKPWYQSRGVIGGLVAVGAGIGSLFGVDVDQATATDIGLQIGTVAGAVFAVIGRIGAEKPIRFVD